jgi:probable rRNA maturation factor
VSAPKPRADRVVPALALQLSVQFASREHRALLPRHLLARWVRAALRRGPDGRPPAPSGEAAQITLRFVGADEGRQLNREFRRRDYPTNVLTFAYQSWPPCADIVLCDSVVAAEAQAQDKAIADHYAHLVVHGVLHALGWDHLRDAQAQRMEQSEREILARLGIGDPYGDGGGRGDA